MVVCRSVISMRDAGEGGGRASEWRWCGLDVVGGGKRAIYGRS